MSGCKYFAAFYSACLRPIYSREFIVGVGNVLLCKPHFERTVKRHFDPVCAFHGKRKSERDCLYCCLCFETITPEQCATEPDGTRVDVCTSCYDQEQQVMRRLARSTQLEDG